MPNEGLFLQETHSTLKDERGWRIASNSCRVLITVHGMDKLSKY